MLQVEYDLKQLAQKINQEMFDASGGQEMFKRKLENLKQKISNNEEDGGYKNDIV